MQVIRGIFSYLLEKSKVICLKKCGKLLQTKTCVPLAYHTYQKPNSDSHDGKTDSKVIILINCFVFSE